jgi:ABC-2 type transport system permease protein
MSSIFDGKIFTIIQHEFQTKVKTKGFIISTLLTPLVLAAFIVIPVVMTLFSGESERKLAVVDYSGKNLGEKIVNIDTSRYSLSNKPVDVLYNKVNNGELDGYLIIPDDFLKTGVANVYSKGGGGLGFISSLESQLNNLYRHEKMMESGLNSELINSIEKDVKLKTVKITKEGTEKDNTVALTILGWVLGFMIYMMMLMYGTFVMRGVIEEKANRIVEVINSSAKPFEIMMGKVIGIGLVGLTQVLIWIIFATIILLVGGPLVQHFVNKPETMAQGMAMSGASGGISGFVMPSISIWIVIAFIFYFLSGYFIYSTLFAAVGSAVDQESDSQALVMPITMLIIIPMLFISSIISNPDSTLAIVLSIFPFWSPIIMIVRIAATDVPLWQVALSVLLEIGTFLGCVWAASRVYRVGILMYGKKVSFGDLIKWVRLAK